MIDRNKARRRALRAAQVVTIGLALVGCGESHESMGDAGDDASMMDAMVADTGSDTSITCDAVFPPSTEECCEAEAGRLLGRGFWGVLGGRARSFRAACNASLTPANGSLTGSAGALVSAA